jgi:tripartite-type tricarboxylate transporter receptor subunit TctC
MKVATLWKVTLGLAVGCTAAGASFAQGYPVRQVELVVPFSPGGSTDAMARIVAPRLSQELGVPVVVVNKPGAGGAIGTNYVLSAPDGSRIGTGGNSNLGPILAIGTSPGYQLGDVAALGRAVTNPMVIVTQKGKFDTLPDFMAQAAKSKDGLQIASWGPKSPAHFFIELLGQQSGARLQHIPFEGGAKAVVGAMGGHVDAAVVTITSALANIQGGKLTALAVTSPQRVDDLPNVPTLGELGFGKATYVSFDGFMTSTKVPADRLDMLRGAIGRVLSDPQVRAELKKTGGDPAFLAARDYDTFLQANVKTLADIAARSNIKE